MFVQKDESKVEHLELTQVAKKVHSKVKESVDRMVSVSAFQRVVQWDALLVEESGIRMVEKKEKM
jgi:hypothetical protein